MPVFVLVNGVYLYKKVWWPTSVSQNAVLSWKFPLTFISLHRGIGITLTWIMYFPLQYLTQALAQYFFSFHGFKLGFNQHVLRFSAPSWHLEKWNSNSLTFKAAAWDGPNFFVLQPPSQREMLILFLIESLTPAETIPVQMEFLIRSCQTEDRYQMAILI